MEVRGKWSGAECGGVEWCGVGSRWGFRYARFLSLTQASERSTRFTLSHYTHPTQLSQHDDLVWVVRTSHLRSLILSLPHSLTLSLSLSAATRSQYSAFVTLGTPASPLAIPPPTLPPSVTVLSLLLPCLPPLSLCTRPAPALEHVCVLHSVLIATCRRTSVVTHFPAFILHTCVCIHTCVLVCCVCSCSCLCCCVLYACLCSFVPLLYF